MIFFSNSSLEARDRAIYIMFEYFSYCFIGLGSKCCGTFPAHEPGCSSILPTSIYSLHPGSYPR